MNTGITSWLLAGALAASLIWNVRTASTATPPACQPCSADACSLDPASLALAPEAAREVQRVALAGCNESAELEAQARARAEELRREIELGHADRARALAGEISTLRGRALAKCVETVLALRERLAPDDFDALLGSCWMRGESGE